MNKFPLVSVIIPVYNGSNYIREAIDSALAQTYKNIEVIVINDGSNDGGVTEKICLSYGNKIRYIHKENGGVSTALNLGINIMKGEYFSWLSHDDKYEPHKVEKQIDAILQYDENVFISLCECKYINSMSESLGKKRKKRFSSNKLIHSDEVMKSLFIQGSINGCSLLINKKVFEKCGFFNENLRYSQDALLWYKIFLSGYSLAYIRDVEVCKRIHSAQLTQKGREIFYKDSCEVAKEIVPLIMQNTNTRRDLLYLYSRRLIIYNCIDAYKVCAQYSENEKIFSLHHKVILQITMFYGKIRPIIRQMYYRIFKGVITR